MTADIEQTILRKIAGDPAPAPEPRAAQRASVASEETQHVPRYVFANSGPYVIGFCRTEGDANEIASRKAQTELIRNYAYLRGMREPAMLGGASREDLWRLVKQGVVVIVPRVSTLLRRPSDAAELEELVYRRGAVVHCVELQGELVNHLQMIRRISDAYLPLETRVSDLEAERTRDMVEHGEEIHNAMILAHELTLSKMIPAFKTDLQSVRSEIARRERNRAENLARAAQFLEAMNNEPDGNTAIGRPQ